MTEENDERMIVARISRTMAMSPSQTTSRVIGSTTPCAGPAPAAPGAPAAAAAAGAGVGSASDDTARDASTGEGPSGRGRGCETLMRHLS